MKTMSQKSVFGFGTAKKAWVSGVAGAVTGFVMPSAVNYLQSTPVDVISWQGLAAAGIGGLATFFSAWTPTNT